MWKINDILQTEHRLCARITRASTWMYSQWNERPSQFTSIIFRTSECLHLVGMRYRGSSAVQPRAPRQSKYIFTRPASPGETVFTASSNRCIAIRPRNSPWKALAALDASGNKPTNIPWCLVHSRINAAAHRSGYCSRMYNPSATANNVPLAMALAIQEVPLVTFRSSQSHVCPQPFKTLMKFVAGSGLSRLVVTNQTFQTPGETCSTVAASPTICPDRLV